MRRAPQDSQVHDMALPERFPDRMTSPINAPPIEHDALLRDIGPLPLAGQAWPDWVRILAWVVLAVLGVQLVTMAIGASADAVDTLLAVIVTLCFLGLLVVSWFMQTSNTTIDETGLRQAWMTKREVKWDDILFAKFVPMLFSKRLIVFTHSGRPVVFQAGTRELRVAFEKIAAVYRRKS